MEPKTCLNPACRVQHFNNYDLCAYCADEKQRELERRLRRDDGAPGIEVVATWASQGFQSQPERVWWIR